MAQATLYASKLTLELETGVNEKGEPVFKNKVYNNVKTASTPDQLMLAASALAELCAYPVNSVIRTDEHDLTV